jgi:ribosomal protein S18 acetylase RimI-like enzyme
VIVRLLQPADLTACARIMAENPLWQRYGVTLDSACQRLSAGQQQGATILVAETAGAVVGFIWYVEKGAFFRSGYVMLIGVDPALQGQGVGEILMDAAESILFETSEDVFLLVSDFNEGAQRFYRHRGYKLVGSLPGYVLPGVSELIYRKRKP